ncbi:MAG: P1 family peptidase [Deltaproteobacteria bacterium]|jgi:L-aminopeptidase/D-esterase-like protein|nr:P1 family peptidase [Deltaproteobacteria bacterium]
MTPITISEIEGFLVGHQEDQKLKTGCTAILGSVNLVASAYTPGFAPGSREMDLLKPESLVQSINGLLLSGGSSFGLAAATGVVKFLLEKNIGFPVGELVVPIVPGAVIFDYPANQSQGRLPDAAMGYAAAAKASQEPVLSGPYGAGYSAASGKIGDLSLSSPSGLGSYGLAAQNGLKVAVLAVVNPLGSVINPKNGQIISGFRRPNGQLASRGEILAALNTAKAPDSQPETGHTVLVAVGTNAKIDKLGAYRLARMAGCGIARAIYPAHLMFDGDTVFALSSNLGPSVELSYLGALAADLVSEAIVRSVPKY